MSAKISAGDAVARRVAAVTAISIGFVSIAVVGSQMVRTESWSAGGTSLTGTIVEISFIVTLFAVPLGLIAGVSGLLTALVISRRRKTLSMLMGPLAVGAATALGGSLWLTLGLGGGVLMPEGVIVPLAAGAGGAIGFALTPKLRSTMSRPLWIEVLMLPLGLLMLLDSPPGTMEAGAESVPWTLALVVGLGASGLGMRR